MSVIRVGIKKSDEGWKGKYMTAYQCANGIKLKRHQSCINHLMRGCVKVRTVRMEKRDIEIYIRGMIEGGELRRERV